MSRQAFNQLLQEIIRTSPDGVKSVLIKYRILNPPTPQVLVLASLKHGEAFVNDLVDTIPNVEILSFIGSGITATALDAEKSYTDNDYADNDAIKAARQEKLKSIIYTGIQAIQTGAEYLKKAKNKSFDKPAEDSYDVQVKKVAQDNAKILGIPKYYFIAGAVLVALIVTFGVVVYLKKHK